MKNIYAFALLNMSTNSLLFGQEPPKLPRLEDYAVTTVYKGESGKLDFKMLENMPELRNELAKWLQKGSNFAGEYTLVTWSCGTECSQHAVVHTPSGRLLGGFSSCGKILYSIDSSLIIINPTHENGVKVQLPKTCKQFNQILIVKNGKLTEFKKLDLSQ